MGWKFLGQKNVSPKSFGSKKEFLSKTILGPNKIWVQNFWVQKDSWGKNDGWKNVGSKIIWGWNNALSKNKLKKKMLGPVYFW